MSQRVALQGLLDDYPVFWAITLGILSVLFLYSTYNSLKSGVARYKGKFSRTRAVKAEKSPGMFWLNIIYTAGLGLCCLYAMLTIILK